MKIISTTAFLLSAFAALLCRGGEPAAGFRCDFDSEREHWHRIGSFMVARRTSFHIADVPGAENGRALVVEAKCSSGFLIMRFPELDLGKYPVMRWRWRIVRRMNLAEGGYDPDDQACVVYIADGSEFRQKCVGYRWEFNTPVGTAGVLKYGGGLRLVKAFCLRNRETPDGEWVVDERNVVEDFKAEFGAPPSAEFVVTIGGNSQHSNSDTRVEIDYIEFRPAPAPAK